MKLSTILIHQNYIFRQFTSQVRNGHYQKYFDFNVKLQGHQSLYQSSLINEQFTIQLSSMDSVCSIKFVDSENIFLKHFSISSFKFLLVVPIP